MREILFRGQTRRNGEKVWTNGEKVPGRWVYGGVLQGCGNHSIIYGGENADKPGEGLNKWVVYTDTLGQYTGLKDKNGKRIFEGDIVRIERAEWGFDGMSTDYRTEQGVIAYDDWGMVGLVVDKYENRPVWSDFFHVCGLTDRVHDWSFEIIGNIHDNPELLKGGGADA